MKTHAPMLLLAILACSKSSTPYLALIDSDIKTHEREFLDAVYSDAPGDGISIGTGEDVVETEDAFKDLEAEDRLVEDRLDAYPDDSIVERDSISQELDVAVETTPDTAADILAEADITPTPPQICGQCSLNEDCVNVGFCADLGYSKGVCLAPCGQDNQCPFGFLCERVNTFNDGQSLTLCVPETICPCTQALKGVSIPCKKSNVYGTCMGVMVCNGNAFSECDAREPQEEQCNGIDDDCNGATDEGFGFIECGLGICHHTVQVCKDGKLQECDPMEGAQPNDEPDFQGIDSDCDGIDGSIASSIFVSYIYGDDTNPGTPTAPKKTIMAGIHAAVLSENKKTVLVSAETYPEKVVLSDGISIYSGYRARENWRRYSADYADIIGPSVGLEAIGIKNPTKVVNLRISATRGQYPSENSIAGLIKDSSDALVFENCIFKASDGASGLKGPDGASGEPGGDGGEGQKGCEDGPGLCGHCSRPVGGAGGYSACGMYGGGGGAPGHDRNGGDPGGDGCCTTPGGAGGAYEKPGQRGQNGANGEPGADGAGGRGNLVISDLGVFVGDGEVGDRGRHGNGGGGGGGGGGSPGIACPDYGGAGGGGGGGGCGGYPGAGGTHGGSSIAVLLIRSQSQFHTCAFATGKGGDGGDGGRGGTGGVGGDGGPGGAGHQRSGAGGSGGKGGNGGRGGHGGGGAGGASIGIACDSESSPKIVNPSFFIGAGGKGGNSPAGNSSKGDDGLSQEVYGCNLR